MLLFPLSPFFWQFGAVRNVPAVSAIKSARLAHRPIPCTFSCQAAFFFGLLLDYWVTPYLILLARLAICRKMSRTRPGQARLPFTPHPSFLKLIVARHLSSGTGRRTGVPAALHPLAGTMRRAHSGAKLPSAYPAFAYPDCRSASLGCRACCFRPEEGCQKIYSSIQLY